MPRIYACSRYFRVPQMWCRTHSQNTAAARAAMTSVSLIMVFMNTFSNFDLVFYYPEQFETIAFEAGLLGILLE